MRGSRYLPRDWPLVGLFVLYPLWWLVGIADLAGILAASAMAVQLVRRRRDVALPRGFSLWALFLLWVVVGVLVLQVNAPGAVAAGSGTRYLTWGYRLAYYLAATVVLLYVGNLRKEISTERLSRILGWMFVTIVCGGLLGFFLPHLDFPSVLEMLLPKRITSIAFVRAQVHPTVAELQNVLGYENPRPSAPFSYSNTWGLNFACFLPFFVRAWCGRGAGRRRLVAPVVLAAAVVPVIFSLNRGLWFSLLVMALLVAVLSAAHGNLRMLAGLVAVMVAVGALVAFTPLGTTIEARFSSETNSNEARANLGGLSIDSMAEASPIVGFGSTRDVQGNFNSIAGGASALCPHCSPPALGTQGRLWLVAFSQGFLGLAFYLGFFVLQFLRHVRCRGSDVTVALCVLLVQSVTLPIYDWSGSALFAVMIALAVLWRARLEQVPSLRAEPTLGASVLWVRRQAPTVACVALTGLVAGGTWQYCEGFSSVASVSVLLPPEPRFPTSGPLDIGSDSDAHVANPAPTTLDTQAQLLTSSTVRSAMRAAAGGPLSGSGAQLSVTAVPNSRILVVAVTARDEETARAAAVAAARTLLAMRAEDLRAQQDAVLDRLTSESASLASAVRTLTASAHGLGAAGDAAHDQVRALRDRRASLVDEWSQLGAQAQQVASLPLSAGHVVRRVRTTQVRNGLPVPLASGLACGLLLGLAASGARDARGRPIGVTAAAAGIGGLPVLARVPGATARGPAAGEASVTVCQQVGLALRPAGVAAYLPVGGSPEVRSLCAALDAAGSVPTCSRDLAEGAGLVLVASESDRVPGLGRRRLDAKRFGGHPAGVILVGK